MSTLLDRIAWAASRFYVTWLLYAMIVLPICVVVALITSLFQAITEAAREFWRSISGGFIDFCGYAFHAFTPQGWREQRDYLSEKPR